MSLKVLIIIILCWHATGLRLQWICCALYIICNHPHIKNCSLVMKIAFTDRINIVAITYRHTKYNLCVLISRQNCGDMLKVDYTKTPQIVLKLTDRNQHSNGKQVDWECGQPLRNVNMLDYLQPHNHLNSSSAILGLCNRLLSGSLSVIMLNAGFTSHFLPENTHLLNC